MEVLQCKSCKLAKAFLLQLMLPRDSINLVVCQNKDSDHFGHVLDHNHVCDDKPSGGSRLW